jgi:flagellar biosynthesis chaperone FliJ
MRTRSLLPLASLLLLACGGSTTSYVKSDAALGRVIVYRNGVAYFEREATVEDDHLRLVAPNDKVDDFLKSLTVVDSATGKPAPISYPHEGGQFVDLKVQLAGGKGTHKVKLSYVTAAPAWKPSYRILVGADGKLELQAWAVVDNTSGEDWTNVKLGVGSSSAMSFLFDLRGFRFVERQQIQAEELFAYAPPTGGSVYGGDGDKGFEFSDDALAAAAAPPPPVTVARAESEKKKSAYDRPSAAKPSAPSREPAAAPRGGAYGGGYAAGRAQGAVADESYAPSYGGQQANGVNAESSALTAQVNQLANQLRYNQNMVTIEGFAKPTDANKDLAALNRANTVRDQLVRSGVDPSRVVAVAKGQQPGRNGGVKIVQNAPKQGGKAADQKAANVVGDPVGTSHFESGQSMTVAKGSSAMVSVYQGKTEGGVVYLYDPESERGNGQFAFKAVRFKNPTDSQLESGPVTVYGDTRFIGEGIAEPIPSRSLAFVPFALDRMVLVEKKGEEKDQISKILTVQRGILNVETKHFRKSHITLNNRGGDKVTVYVRHTPVAGYTLEGDFAKAERFGAAYLMPVEIAPHSKAEVDINESTPITRTTDIRTSEGLDLVKAYVSSDLVKGEIKEAVEGLIKQQVELANIETRIQTTRDQMSEYRTRMDELHAQILTLKMVKSAGPMMANLEKKLSETSDKVSRLTIQVADLQEQAMIARIKFQDLVAELSMDADGKRIEEKIDDKKPTKGPVKKG